LHGPPAAPQQCLELADLGVVLTTSFTSLQICFIICLQYNNIYLEESKSELWWKAKALLDYCTQLYQISFLLKEMRFNFH